MLTYGDAPSGGGLVRQDAIKYQRVDTRFGAGRFHPPSTLGGLRASALPRRRHGFDLDLEGGVACGGVVMSCFYQSARKAVEWNTMEANHARKMEQ